MGLSVCLGEVATFVRGITFKPNDVLNVCSRGAVACMRTKNVQTTLDLSDVWGISEHLVKRKDQYLRSGDLLVSSANSWNLVGRCCWVPDLPWRSTFGGFISVLRADRRKIDPRYLFWWFASERTQAAVRSFGQRTTNISNLNFERCMQLPVSLPPLPEQRRIAAILDKANELRAKRRAGLAQLDTLAQSIFLEMFGDPIRNPKSWDDRINLGQVADIVSGVTKGRKTNAKPTRVVPYLAVANVQDRSLHLTSVKSIEATEEEIARYHLQRNDLLMTEGGDPDKLGRGTLWNGEISECIHQNHIFRVRLRGEAPLDPQFLSDLIGGARGKKYFLAAAKQTTGIASINMTQLRNFPLLMPPLALQREFVARKQAAELLAEKQKRALSALDALFASLQHRAFRGEL